MNWMLYGANGYTGELVAREAVRRGLRPTLAGRSESRIHALGAELGLDCRVFALDDEATVRANLAGHRLVLHCAGPFSETSRPMLSACLAGHVHYLDITGEIQVFEHVHGQAEAARRADVALVPGVGFDVVPSDCLAASLVEALPAATRLQLAFEAGGGPSPGTAKTSLEGIGMGGRVRRDGRIVSVPLAWKSRTIPFAHGERTAVTIPWGDVFTAFVSTGVPDIEVYMALPPATAARMRRLRWLRLDRRSVLCAADHVSERRFRLWPESDLRHHHAADLRRADRDPTRPGPGPRIPGARPRPKQPRQRRKPHQHGTTGHIPDKSQQSRAADQLRPRPWTPPCQSP